jgi:hypothetical protein
VDSGSEAGMTDRVVELPSTPRLAGLRRTSRRVDKNSRKGIFGFTQTSPQSGGSAGENPNEMRTRLRPV